LALLALGLLSVASLSFAGLPGCSSSETNPSRPTAVDGGRDGSTVTLTPEQMFRALEKELVATCGGTNGTCHVNGTLAGAQDKKWLAPPDAYISAKNYPGVLPASGDTSDCILLSQIQHTGPALSETPKLFGQVREWVAAELNAMTAKLPATAPFTVQMGFNEVDLSNVVPGIDGAKISFLATENGSILSLGTMRVTGPTVRGLTMDSPFFVIIPPKGPIITNPNVNGFTGPLEVPAGQSVDMYSGSLIMTKWTTGGKLKIVFPKIGPLLARDAGTSGGCNALAQFNASAVAGFKMAVPLDEGGTGSCYGCHNGGSPVAQNAMDLSALDTNNAVACAQAKFWINFQNKSQSVLILTPSGGSNPNHPVTSLPANQQPITDIMAWVNAETP
jgi:hypothetical protein